MRKETVVLVTVAAVALVAALETRRKRRRERQGMQTQRILHKFARECATPVPKLWEVANALVSDMQASPASQETSSVNMLVSYVDSLPIGAILRFEFARNQFFFVLCERIGGKNEPISDLHREEISIPSNVFVGTYEELFDYVAMEVAKFAAAHPNDGGGDEEKKLGYTVSYPVDQAAASSGSAIKWKCFSADDAIGKAFANDINRTLEKHGVSMHVFALIDNPIGELAGGRYYNKDVVAAVTLALSSNAAYVEKAEAVPNWLGPSPNSGDMVINTGWDQFNCSNLPVTEFDASLDAESANPGSRIFEKLVSAIYLGEIVRTLTENDSGNSTVW